MPAAKTHGGARAGAGGPKHRRTEQRIFLVSSLAGLGANIDRISRVSQISIPTLKTHYPDELKTTMEDLNQNVAAVTLSCVLSPDPRHNALRMFWLRSKAGWQDQKDVDAIATLQSVLQMMQPMTMQEWQQQHPKPKQLNGNGHARNGS